MGSRSKEEGELLDLSSKNERGMKTPLKSPLVQGGTLFFTRHGAATPVKSSDAKTELDSAGAHKKADVCYNSFKIGSPPRFVRR